MDSAAFWLITALWLQGALALCALGWLGAQRVPRILRGEIDIRDIALSRDGWPETAIKASNAFDNQFQLPVLLYLAGGLALYLGPNWYEATVAMLFVFSRLIHYGIHITTNHVPRRFFAYVVGAALLLFLWGELLGRLFYVAGTL